MVLVCLFHRGWATFVKGMVIKDDLVVVGVALAPSSKKCLRIVARRVRAWVRY